MSMAFDFKIKHIAWIIMAIILSACSTDLGSMVTPTPEGGVEVDTIFREFYQTLGGSDVMGSATSQAFQKGDYWEQYTVAGLMRYDRLASGSQLFSLSPVGLKLHIQDTPLGIPQQDSITIENGIIIYSKFVARYKALQGTRFAGKPLSQPRLETLDDGSTRIAQYFENLGFYTSGTDPTDGVHMLAYGSWACDVNCRYQPPAAAKVSQQAVYSQPFLESVSRLGSDFVGPALSSYYRAKDGAIEQVYENMVVYAPANNMRLIGLRPVPELVGYPPQAPVPQINAASLVFRPLAGDLGHNVPQVFEQYIALHGSILLSGPPTTERFTAGKVYRQCFKAYCLDYDPSAPPSMRVRPAPLGKRYLQLFPPPASVDTNPAPANPDLILLVDDDSPVISTHQKEKINARVLKANDHAPVPNILSTLTLNLPEDRHLTYSLNATDNQGDASVVIDPIEAQNGTIIPYQVCLDTDSQPQVCVSESFLIWNNP